MLSFLCLGINYYFKKVTFRALIIKCFLLSYIISQRMRCLITERKAVLLILILMRTGQSSSVRPYSTEHSISHSFEFGELPLISSILPTDHNNKIRSSNRPDGSGFFYFYYWIWIWDLPRNRVKDDESNSQAMSNDEGKTLLTIDNPSHISLIS